MKLRKAFRKIGTTKTCSRCSYLENELQKQKAFLKTFIETIPAFVFYKDQSSRYLGCNQVFAEKFARLSETELIGKTDFEIMTDRELARTIYQEDQEILKKGVCQRHEEKFVSADGHIIDIETITAPFHYNGKVEGLIGISYNITASRDLKEEWRQEKEYAQLLLNIVPSAIYSVDLNNKITSWNNEAKLLTGYSPSEVIGKESSYYIPWQNFKSSWLADSMSEECPKIATLITKEGRCRHVMRKTAVIKDKDGKITGKLEALTDISRMIQIEAALKESQDRFSAIVNHAPQIIIIHRGGIIKFVNAAGLSALGFDVNYMLGRQLSEFLTLQPGKDIKLLLAASSKQAAAYEADLSKKSGDVIHVLAKGTNLKFEGVNAQLIVFIDMTEKKRAENMLRERERESQRELDLAARAQQNSLPQFFHGEKVRVDKIFRPHHTVSGDLLNYRRFTAKQKLCGYVVDVSGHGMATALQTATFKMLLDNTLLSGGEINADVFQGINQKILPYLQEGTFAGLLYFEFDFKVMCLKVISAGITLFLTAKADKCELVPVSGGLLGIFDQADVGTFTMPFAPGEVYFMMSDGLSDMIEESGLQRQKSLTGYKRWLEKLVDSPARQDDCSCVSIEILKEAKNICVVTIQDEYELEEAQKTIADYLESNVPIYACPLDVVVNEAVNNGMRAGGLVRVTFRRLKKRIVIRVRDYGAGFAAKEIVGRINSLSDEELDAEFEARQLAESGRGIFIMKMFCDRIVYNKKGNEVLLMKRL